MKVELCMSNDNGGQLEVQIAIKEKSSRNIIITSSKGFTCHKLFHAIIMQPWGRT